MPVLDVKIDPSGAVAGGRVVERSIAGMTQRANQLEDTLSVSVNRHVALPGLKFPVLFHPSQD